MIRTFVFKGQYGFVSSPGMGALQRRIPNSSLHEWDDMSVVQKINALPLSVLVALIGYSLGGNRLQDIGEQVKRPIQLGVAYDPSRLYARVRDGHQIAPPTYKRFLCYQNVGAWMFGGSYYVGKQVEVTHVNTFHLAVQFDERLHAMTIAAIKELH